MLCLNLCFRVPKAFSFCMLLCLHLFLVASATEVRMLARGSRTGSELYTSGFQAP